MFQNLHPKCANPSCPAAFDWLDGGRLFRFHRSPTELSGASGSGNHHIEHFWLCERCSHIFTLEYDSATGVSIRPLWPELPARRKTIELPIF
jgi:hypothetical protein